MPAGVVANSWGQLNNNLGRFFDKMNEAKEERKREGQEAQSLRKLLGVVYPDRKGEFDVLGLAELKGELQGYSLSQLAEDRGMQRDLHKARLGEMKERAGGRQRFREGMGALMAPPAMPSPMMEEGVPIADQPAGYMMDESATGVAANAPDGATLERLAMEMAPEDFHHFAQGRRLLAEANEAGQGRDRVPEEMMLAGRPTIFNRHTGAFQVLPPMDAEADAIIDPSTGEPVPGMLSFGGKPTRLPTDRSATDARSEADTFAKLNDQLIRLDDELRAWEANQERKGARKRGPEEKAQLERQKAAVLRRLDALDAPSGAAKGAEAGISVRAKSKTVAAGDKVLVEKDGKRFRLPRAQLPAALKQGFKEVKGK